MVYEVIGGGWTYRLKPLGRRGRNKVRHFNDLKNATIRSTEMESSNEEVLAEIVSLPPPSGYESKKQEFTRERGNGENQKTDNPKKSQGEEPRCQSDKQSTALRRSTMKCTTTKRL